MTIRAVLLDADGVVQTTAPDFEAGLRNLVEDPVGVEEFLLAAFEAERRALVGEGDFRADLESVLRRFASARSIDEAMRAWSSIAPDAGVLDVVTDLRASGVPCYVASNQQAYRATHMSVELGYADRFDGEFYSYALRARKPDPRFFERILEALSIPASTLLFVDDHVPNVESAAALGIRAERFDVREHDAAGDALRALLGRHGVA